MSDEIPAQRLAEWLKSPPGTAPPDGIDPDVLAAVWALVPDRAPAPRVSLDDILSRVESGPFATSAPTTGTVIGFPSPLDPRATGAAAQPKRRSARAWWAAPALGISLAAAAAALLVLPMAAKLLSPDLVATEERQLAAAPASAPASATEAAPELLAAAGIPEAEPAVAVAGEPTTTSTATPKALERSNDAPLDAARNRIVSAAPAPAADAPGTRPAEESLAFESKKEDVAALGPGLAAREPSGGSEARTPSGGAATGDGDAEGSTGGNAGGYATASGSAGAKEKDSSRASSARPLPSTSPPPAPPKRAASIPESEEDENAQTDDWRDAAQSGAPKSGPTKSRADTSVAAPPAAQAPAAASTAPLDYNGEWYRAVPDVVAAYTAARADEAAGQWDAAVNRWKTLMAHRRADVAQDAALRAAKALRNAGRANEALAAVDQGLRRSGGNTPFRSSLLGLRAELLAELGRASDAKNALDEMGESNEAR